MSIDDAADPLVAGDEALASGDWGGARAMFERTLADGPSARAEEGLGRALWWLKDTERAIAHMERAYAAHREAGELGPAIANALWLSREFAAAPLWLSCMRSWSRRGSIAGNSGS
jgi:hypothetical protein